MTNGKEKRNKKTVQSWSLKRLFKEVGTAFSEGLKPGGLPFFKRAGFLKGVLAVVVVLVLSLFVLPDIQFVPSRYQIGGISPKNVKAPQDFDVPDQKATEEKRRQVMKGVLSVYDFDLSIVDTLKENIQEAFRVMNRYYVGRRLRIENAAQQKALKRRQLKKKTPSGEAPTRTKTEKELFEESYQEFQKLLEIKLPGKTLRVLETEQFSPELATAIGALLQDVMNRGIVSSPDLLLKETGKGITIKGVGESFEREVRDVNAFLDLKSAREHIRKDDNPALRSLSPEAVRAVREIAFSLVVPNLTFNKNETEFRKSQAKDAVKTVFYKVQKGEMIVREGEKISQEEMAKLKALNAVLRENNPFRVFLGLVFFNSILLAVFLLYINRFKRSVAADLQKLTLLGLIIIGSLGLIKAFYWIARILMTNLQFVDPASVLFGIPFAVCGMLIGVLFEVRIFNFPILIISILSGIMIHEDLSFTLYALIGNVTAALTVQNCRRRSALLRGGLMVGGANALTALAISMVHNDLSLVGGVEDVVFAFFGGLLVSVLVSWMVPILESLFRITTDIRLLELSDTNQRVLKELLVNAPGTYQHSLMVGNLSEEAAESVGANSLLARVSSLYHDIGKIQKAEYFVENQINLENRHDKLMPSMSVLILTSHVKDGVELARENKLPPAILDIIRQHHGTSLITYFYQKAKEKENPSLHAIKEEDYRYPGPKPQTREAAIVMIADAIEAASRVLTNPTPSRIEGMVNKLMERIYIDGQLDECDLTLKDLRKIKKSLIPILTSIYHHRIDYPSVKLAEGNEGTRRNERMAQSGGDNAQDSTGMGEVRLEKSLRNRT